MDECLLEICGDNCSSVQLLTDATTPLGHEIDDDGDDDGNVVVVVVVMMLMMAVLLKIMMMIQYEASLATNLAQYNLNKLHKGTQILGSIISG